MNTLRNVISLLIAYALQWASVILTAPVQVPPYTNREQSHGSMPSSPSMTMSLFTELSDASPFTPKRGTVMRELPTTSDRACVELHFTMPRTFSSVRE